MPDSSGLRFFSVEDINKNYRSLLAVALEAKKKAWQHDVHQAREAYNRWETQQNARTLQGLSILLLQICLVRLARPESLRLSNNRLSSRMRYFGHEILNIFV